MILTESDLYGRLVAALNFGFAISRNSTAPSINGRLSEYHAAVGLAGLDSWPAKSESLNDVARRYRESFVAAELGDKFFAQPDVDGNYALYLCASDAEAAGVQAKLSEARIDSRFWYDKGLHHHRHFSSVARDDLPVTELLGRRLIGLPMAPDLEDIAIRRIVEAVGASVGARPHRETETRVSPTK